MQPPHDDYTLRELADMARARSEYDWAHTSSVLALIAETHRNPKQRSRPYTPADFNPLLARRRKRYVQLTPEQSAIVFAAMAGQRLPRKPTLWDTIVTRRQPTQ